MRFSGTTSEADPSGFDGDVCDQPFLTYVRVHPREVIVWEFLIFAFKNLISVDRVNEVLG